MPGEGACGGVEVEPGEGGRGAFVGFANGAGVEPPGASALLAAGDMGVAEEKDVGVGGQGWGDVGEEEGAVAEAEADFEGPGGFEVVVAADDEEALACGVEGLEELGFADVAQVPDRVGGVGGVDEGGGKAVVGIGEDEDALEGGWWGGGGAGFAGLGGWSGGWVCGVGHGRRAGAGREFFVVRFFRGDGGRDCCV